MKAYKICMGVLLSLAAIASVSIATIHHHKFVIEETTVNRLCGTHNIITVNGQFPGPTLEVCNGDSLVVEVLNSGRYNATIHWHGIRQLRNPWADGPEYVTQCPIKPGETYTYRFTIEDQEGTLWWHAHSRWLRATVYGALVILPKLGTTYPFPKPIFQPKDLKATFCQTVGVRSYDLQSCRYRWTVSLEGGTCLQINQRYIFSNSLFAKLWYRVIDISEAARKEQRKVECLPYLSWTFVGIHLSSLQYVVVVGAVAVGWQRRMW